MAPDFPQLTLDLSPPKPSIPSNFFQFLIPDNSIDLTLLNYYIHGLEDELTKIQAFQRELPLSFLLLNHAVTKLKEATSGKKNEEKESENGGKFDQTVGAKLGFNEFDNNKKNWMSSAQLWSPISEDEALRRCEDRGVILSFSETTDDYVPGLSLVTPGLNFLAGDEPGPSKGNKIGGTGSFSGSVLYTNPNKLGKPGIKVPYQTARKRRRCWSPELHRRFVDTLERLGGSQVATPKQIRDLMQVDGLTNDEVKSHLQKYRLHTRRPSSAIHNNSIQQQTPQFVVVGGIWVPPPEYAAVAAVTTAGDTTTTVVPPSGIYAPIATVASPHSVHQTSTTQSQSHCEERASHSEGGVHYNSPTTSSSTHTSTGSHAH